MVVQDDEPGRERGTIDALMLRLYFWQLHLEECRSKAQPESTTTPTTSSVTYDTSGVTAEAGRAKRLLSRCCLTRRCRQGLPLPVATLEHCPCSSIVCALVPLPPPPSLSCFTRISGESE
jgi:hypothetical protein